MEATTTHMLQFSIALKLAHLIDIRLAQLRWLQSKYLNSVPTIKQIVGLQSLTYIKCSLVIRGFNSYSTLIDCIYDNYNGRIINLQIFRNFLWWKLKVWCFVDVGVCEQSFTIDFFLQHLRKVNKLINIFLLNF
jgi:hypothetical protein